MRASEAIYITADKRLGVLHGKDFWLAAFGAVPPGGEAYDFGEMRVMYEDGSIAFACISVRTINPMDRALEAQSVDVSPVAYVTDERKVP